MDPVQHFEDSFLKAASSHSLDSEVFYKELHAIEQADGGPNSAKFKADLQKINDTIRSRGLDSFAITGLDDQNHKLIQARDNHSHAPETKSNGSDAPVMSEPVLQKKVEELHDAINRRKYFGTCDDHDFDEVQRVIKPVTNPQDLKRLEQIYHDKYDAKGDPHTLRNEAKAHLSEHEFRQFEGQLNRQDDRTNDAGNLMAALSHAKEDKDAGNAEVRSVLSTLSSKDLAQLDKDFRVAYGQSYKDALNESKDLTPATREALSTLERGSDSWQHDKNAIKQLAQSAVNEGDTRSFGEALRVNTPEAAQARQELLADSAFKQSMADHFPSKLAAENPTAEQGSMKWEDKVDPVALDYLTEGHVSLKTITDQNTGKWFLNNKENIELAARNATEQERNDYKNGRELAQTGGKPKSADEQKALDYYNKIHDAFTAGGSDREACIWEDQLMHGRESIVSQMAKCHSDGSVFGLGSGHSKEEIMNRVESLSKEDYDLLRSKEGPAFRKQIEESVKQYCDSDETRRIMKMIDAKADKPSYEECQNVRRGLTEAMGDNKGHGLLGLGTSYDAKNILPKLASMTPEDAKAYKNNENNFKTNLDKFVSDNLNDVEKVSANRLLHQVEATGKPPQPDEVDKLLAEKESGSAPAQILEQAEKVLQDPAARARLNKPDAQLSDEDRVIKSVITEAATQVYNDSSGISDGGAPPAVPEQQLKTLFETGHLPVQQKQDLGIQNKDLISDIVAAPESERQEALKKLAPDERQVVQSALANPDHKLDLADRMRLFAIGTNGDYSQFHDELQGLSKDGLQKLREEYAKKYNGDLDNDLIGKVDKKDQAEYRTLLNPSQGDGRQNFYDRVSDMLKSESGLSADGTNLTMEKAGDEVANKLSEYQRIYKTLPPEEQQALDKHFSEAINQHKESKQKLAEIVADAAITAGALAATPFTGGASMALVASLAAAGGAAARPLLLKGVEGKDFDSSTENILRQAGIGGFSAALNFIGGEALMGAGEVASGAGRSLTEGALALAGENAVDTAGKQALKQGLTKLAKSYGGKELSGSEAAAFKKELESLVEKSAPNASDEARRSMVESVKQNFDHTVSEHESKVAQRIAERTRAQVAKDYAKKVGADAATGAVANAASEVVVPTLSGGKPDWNEIGTSAATGFGTGAIIGALIHAPGLAQDFKVNLRKTTGPDSDHPTVAINSNDQAGEVVVRQNNGNEVHLKPGDGQTYNPQVGDEIVAAPVVAGGAVAEAGKVANPVTQSAVGEGQSAPDVRTGQPQAAQTQSSAEVQSAQPQGSQTQGATPSDSQGQSVTNPTKPGEGAASNESVKLDSGTDGGGGSADVSAKSQVNANGPHSVVRVKPAPGAGTVHDVDVHLNGGAKAIVDEAVGKITGQGVVEVSGNTTNLEINVPEGQTMRIVLKEGKPNINVSPASKGSIEVVSENGLELPSRLKQYRDSTAMNGEPKVTVLERRDLAMPVGEVVTTEHGAFSPQELQAKSAELAARLQKQGETVSREQWRDMFDGAHDMHDGGPARQFSAEEKRLALEAMRQSAPNMNSRAVDGQMQDLGKNISPDGKGKVTVYVTDGASDGNGLAHVFAKNNPGVSVEIKTLNPDELQALQANIQDVNQLQRQVDSSKSKIESLKKKLGDRMDREDKGALRQKLESESASKKALEEQMRNAQSKLPANTVIFDDAAQLTQSQKATLGRLSNLRDVTMADMNGFSRGMNMYDFATTGITHDTTSMNGKLVDIVKGAQQLKASHPEMSEAGAVSAYLRQGGTQAFERRGKYMHGTTENPSVGRNRKVTDAMNYDESQLIDALYRQATQPMASQQQIEKYLANIATRVEKENAARTERGQTALPGTVEDYQTAALMSLDKNAHFNDYPTMAKQASELEHNIQGRLTAEGLGKDDYLIVTGLEKDGSSYLVNNLYARANNIPANRFISMQELEKLSHDPAEAERVLGHKKLVFLDDYINSGRQQAELLSGAQRDVLSHIKGTNGQPLVEGVIAGSLGKHQLPPGAMDPIYDWGRGALTSVGPNGEVTGKPGQLGVENVTGELLADLNDPMLRLTRSMQEFQDYLNQMGSGSMYSGSSVASGIFTPYGSPNNNPGYLIQGLRPFRLPYRYKTDPTMFGTKPTSPAQ